MQRFPKNARVVFLGDSITKANNYTQRIIAHYKKNYPEDRVKFWNCGIAGGTAECAAQYLADDVLPLHPTHVVFTEGVNDSGRWMLEWQPSPQREAKLDERLTQYIANVNTVCGLLLFAGVSVILCTPAPYAEFIRTEQEPLAGGYRLILRYAAAMRDSADERGLPLVDFHARMAELYPIESVYNADHVHPNDRGQYRMAECFLRAQGETIEDYRPIAEVSREAGLERWAQLVETQRNVWGTELMVIGNYTLPPEEKIRFVETYLAEKRYGDRVYFKNISEIFLRYYPERDALRAEIGEIMESYYDGGENG